MAKYSIDDTTMTSLANSARALTGGTAGLTPSGIKSVMDTEKLNVDAALVAIAAKGVNVGSGSNSDDLATLIAAIEAGGGGDVTATWGMITPASTSTVTIEHGLGKRPVVWGFLYASSFDSAPDNCAGHITAIRRDAATGNYTTTVGRFNQPARNVSSYTMYGTSRLAEIDTEESSDITWGANKNFLKINPSDSQNRDSIAVGDTYIWYVLGTD